MILCETLHSRQLTESELFAVVVTVTRHPKYLMPLKTMSLKAYHLKWLGMPETLFTIGLRFGFSLKHVSLKIYQWWRGLRQNSLQRKHIFGRSEMHPLRTHSIPMMHCTNSQSRVEPNKALILWSSKKKRKSCSISVTSLISSLWVLPVLFSIFSHSKFNKQVNKQDVL